MAHALGRKGAIAGAATVGLCWNVRVDANTIVANSTNSLVDHKWRTTHSPLALRLTFIS